MLTLPRGTLDPIADATGHAAGVLFVEPQGDVLLLRRNDGETNYGGHWALPGGKAEDGETPEQAADRECREEIGPLKRGEKRIIDRRRTPTGMVFTTFARQVPGRFAPKLNDEHTGYAWAPINALPQPLHPAVKATLEERLGFGGELTKDDWQEWAASDWAAPLAGDSALRLAFDKETVRSTDADGRMRISRANISKATVNEYLGKEIMRGAINGEELSLETGKLYRLLRHPDDLAKAAATFNGVQLLQKHLPVSAEDPQQWDTVGCVGTDCRYEHPYLVASLSVWAQDAIDGIESEKQRELSSSYRYRAEMTPGSFDGMAFDGVMRDIVGNHVALVEDGRAGPDVIVGDSNEEVTKMSNREVAKTIAAVAARTVSIQAMDVYLRPRLAQDAKPNFAKMFEGVKVGRIKDAKPKIVAFAKQLKLAKDASLDDVEKVLDMLDGHEVKSEAVDESVSDPQHNAMEAAAAGNSELGIPKAVGEEFVSQDAEVANFLKGKGVGDEDIKTALGLMKPKAGDEDPEERKKREAEEAEKKKAADAEAEAKKDEKDKPMDKKAQDAAIKLAVDSALGPAIEEAKKSVRAEQTAIRQAEQHVRPFVGELDPGLAFDSAAAVYRHALKMRGVDNVDKIHESALATVLGLLPKAGARPAEVPNGGLAFDSAAQSDFTKRFPGSERIQAA